MPSSIVFNNHRNVQLRVVPSAVAVDTFDLIVSGEATADTGEARSVEITLNSADAIFTDPQREKLNTLFRRCRRGWKKSALNEDAE